MVSMNRYRLALSALALATLAFIIACGTSETATVTPPPAATSATAATLVPTLIPAATDAPAMEGPQGTINVAVDDLGPALFMLRTQSHRPGRFDTLVSHDTMFATTPDGKVIPRLVKEWSADSTGLILTFKLQEGVKWQQQYGDWGEFDADDFLFSIEDVSTEATPHPAHAKILQVFGCEECGLTKIDQYTIQLKRPEPTILVTWGSRAPVGVSMTFHSKRHFEAVGEEVATHEQSVGSGAWELIEHRPADRNILRAVPNHWRKTPNFEEMHWIAIGEPATKVANFLTGAIDTGQFTLEDVQTIKDEQDPDHKFMTFPGAAQAGVYLLGQNYNTDHPAHHPTPDGVAGADSPGRQRLRL